MGGSALFFRAGCPKSCFFSTNAVVQAHNDATKCEAETLAGRQNSTVFNSWIDQLRMFSVVSNDSAKSATAARFATDFAEKGCVSTKTDFSHCNWKNYGMDMEFKSM